MPIRDVIAPLNYSRTLNQIAMLALAMGIYAILPVAKEYSPYKEISDSPSELHAALSLTLGWLLVLSVRNAARGLESSLGSKVHKHKRYREWLTTTSSFLNAAVTAYDLQREVSSLTQGLHVSYSVYDMAWSRIGALPQRSQKESEETPRFAPAPQSADDFDKLIDTITHRLA